MTTLSTKGAIHALESLAQLAGENCTVTNAPINLNDSPRFGFRGLMIDTARHYMPVQFIQHIIDGMAALKLNVMHWHIVDAQSFPYVSTLFPGTSRTALSRPPAFRQLERTLMPHRIRSRSSRVR